MYLNINDCVNGSTIHIDPQSEFESNKSHDSKALSTATDVGGVDRCGKRFHFSQVLCIAKPDDRQTSSKPQAMHTR